MAEAFSGGKWHGVEVKPPANASTSQVDNALNGVSCWSAGHCVAVGRYASSTLEINSMAAVSS